MSNYDNDIELPPLPSPFGIVNPSEACECGIYDLKDLHDYAKSYAAATAEPYRKALHDLIRDLEMRSNLKRGDDKGVVDCGNGVYRQALIALGELK